MGDCSVVGGGVIEDEATHRIVGYTEASKYFHNNLSNPLACVSARKLREGNR
jgi:hypothetical protein